MILLSIRILFFMISGIAMKTNKIKEANKQVNPPK